MGSDSIKSIIMDKYIESDSIFRSQKLSCQDLTPIFLTPIFQDMTPISAVQADGIDEKCVLL